jgi:class 3 adenylate cyclase
MGIDVITNTYVPTIYYVTMNNNAYKNQSILSYTMMDQNQGTILFTFFSMSTPINTFAWDVTSSYMYWYDYYLFNTNTGQPQLLLSFQVPTNDMHASFGIDLFTTVYAVSDFLRTMLHGPKERLYLFFRSTTGLLVGATHGKYFSNSDVDYSKNNPLLNPPPVSEFKKFTPTDSTDPTIQSSAVWLLSQYQGWDTIPDLNVVQSLVGEDYWITTQHISSAMGLKVQLVLLIDVASTLGQIIQNRQTTLNNIAATNNKLTIILVVVVVAALIFAVLISLIITRSLGQLAFGMDSLSVLDFAEDLKSSLLASGSRFSEVSKCERSFHSLERGLKAFVKYVPTDVVKMMLVGDMESNNVMNRKAVSILFMDIPAFTDIAEKIQPDQLMTLTTDYLQGMCDVIVHSHGTLDKFIGDCIMAIWNAPRSVKYHEAHACGAAIDMQYRLLELYQKWDEEGLPHIRFRAGINTDAVLVGNFGCDFRIAYTCLGDGVNLAARLEAANKHFKTTVLVAETTCKNAGNRYFFRKIAHVTVPGKAEILPIYELLIRNPDFGKKGKQKQDQLEQPSQLQTEDEDLPAVNVPVLTSPTLSIQTTPSDIGSPISRPLLVHEELLSPTVGNETDDKVLNSWRFLGLEQTKALKEHYDKGLEDYLRGNLDEAGKWLNKCLQLVPDDGASAFILDRCEQGKKKRDTNWDGVIRFDKK